MTPVTLHPLLAGESMVGLRVECPHTGQIICTTLTLDQQRELLASLSGSVARSESIMADPYAPAVARLADWHARHAEGCADCDKAEASACSFPNCDSPCICEIARAEPLIGRAHGEAEYPMSTDEQLNDALAGR